MTAALCLAMCLAVPPDDTWKFRDESERAGRSVITYRTVELSATPGKPLDKDDQPPPGAKYGTIALGPGGKLRLGLVFHAATNTVWFDADGDGRFAAAERFVLGAQPHGIKVRLAFEDKMASRTLLIRKRGDGLAYGIRGYAEGAIRLSGKRIAALLTDGDADGCFDGVGTDRVWLDLDGDGKFDPLTEQFSLGTVITHAGHSFLVRPQPDGLAVAVHERPAEFGALVLGLTKLAQGSLVELSTQLVSEWGELVTVKEADKPLKLPIGKYRVESVELKLAGPDGKVWHYGFSAGGRAPNIEIAQGKQTTHVLLNGFKIALVLDPSVAAPGSAVLVRPDLVAAGGLFMTRCEVVDRHGVHGREAQATLRLSAPGRVVLDEAVSGFN